jgi:hypothetical protein
VINVYITFGQCHAHAVAGKTFDRNCVALIKAENINQGREKAFEYFGDKWFTSYSPNSPEMEYFPRGIIEVES